MLVSDVYVFDGTRLNLDNGYQCNVSVFDTLCEIEFSKVGHFERIKGQEAVDALMEIGNKIEQGRNIHDAFEEWFVNYMKE